MTCINLIPAYRVDAWQRRVRLHRWLVICGVYAAVALVATAVATTLMRRGGRDLTSDIAAAQVRIASVDRAAATLRPQLGELRATLEASRSVTRQPDWSLLLAMLGEIRGQEVFLRLVELRPGTQGGAPAPQALGDQSIAAHPDGYVVAIGGLGLSQIDVSRFVLRLEQTGLFDSVAVIATRREPYENTDAVAFQIEGSLSGRKDQQP